MTPELLTVVQLAGNALVTWGVLRTVLNQVLRDLNRAHRRLDAIGAPACTEEQPLQI